MRQGIALLEVRLHIAAVNKQREVCGSTTPQGIMSGREISFDVGSNVDEKRCRKRLGVSIHSSHSLELTAQTQWSTLYLSNQHEENQAPFHSELDDNPTPPLSRVSICGPCFALRSDFLRNMSASPAPEIVRLQFATQQFCHELHWCWETLIDRRIALPHGCVLTEQLRTQVIDNVDTLHDEFRAFGETPPRTDIYNAMGVYAARLARSRIERTEDHDMSPGLSEEADALQDALLDIKLTEPPLRFHSTRFAQIRELTLLIMNRLQLVEDTTRHITAEQAAEEENVYWSG